MYDIKNLAKLKRLDEKNPETMKAFWAFVRKEISKGQAATIDCERDKAAFAPGAIDISNSKRARY